MELLTTSNITFVLVLLGILFSIYRYFRDPDESADKSISILQAQQQSDREGTDRRFKDVQENFDKVNALLHEHITSDGVKFESLNATQISMGKDLVKIATILEERLPVATPRNKKHIHG